MSLTERKVIYTASDYSESDLVTLKQAADLLDISMPGVIQMIYRGKLTEVINQLNPDHHGRRMVPLHQVTALMRAK
jgi:hypothetical protein